MFLKTPIVQKKLHLGKKGSQSPQAKLII